jgi:hypothetical protein
MSDGTIIRLVRSVAALGAGLAVISLALTIAAEDVGFWWRSFAGLNAVVAVAFAPIVWLVVPRQPRNATVWAMSASAGSGVHAAALSLIPFATDRPIDVIDPDWIPSDLGGVTGWLQVVGAATSVPGLFVPLTLGLIVFPDGRFPSRRWRTIGVLSALAITVLALTHGWWYRPTNSSRQEHPLIIVSGMACVLLTVTCVAGLIARFRRSTGTARLQYKWIVMGTTVGAIVFCGFFFLPDAAYDEPAAALVGMTAAVCWVVSYGIAVARYRLYEIDVVLSRTVVYLSLAVLITGFYVVVVVVIGDLVGGSSVWLSVAATALVALTFEPAGRTSSAGPTGSSTAPRHTVRDPRRGDQRRLAAAERSEDLLSRLADRLRAGTGAHRVTVWLEDGWARARSPPLRPMTPFPTSVRPTTCRGTTSPSSTIGEPIGHLTVEERPGAALRPTTPDSRRPCRLGCAVVRKLRLDRDLEATAAKIAESRRRLLDAEDEERRRLERELNTGIEQQVVALKVQLGLAKRAREGRRKRAGCDTPRRPRVDAGDATRPDPSSRPGHLSDAARRRRARRRDSAVGGAFTARRARRRRR